MEALKQADSNIVIWLNQWVGEYRVLDQVVEVVVSDYFTPVTLALSLLWLWFATRDPGKRMTTQRAVITAIASLAIANLVVLMMNDFYFRPRPFTEMQLNLLFYRPTDSSFPANPAALSFAIAFSILQTRRGAGAILLGIAAIWSLSRVYAGVFYLSDVAAGAAIGVTTVLCMNFLLRWLDPVPTAVLRVGKALHLA